VSGFIEVERRAQRIGPIRGELTTAARL